MTTFAPRTETVDAWGGRFDLRFQVAGSGPALVYLHPAGGMFWDDLLQGLSDRFTVYAPMFPGTDPLDTMSIHQVDDIFDVVLAYEGALRSLGLQGAPAIGPSFGGMLAAELGQLPRSVQPVILLDPAGLWSESAPWSLDFMCAPPERIPGLLFKHPEAPGPRRMFAPPSPERALDVAVNTIWALGCVAKFLWPVPDRGLSKRLHRVSAPDPGDLGRRRRADSGSLRAGVRPADSAQQGGGTPGLRPCSPSRTSRRNGGLGQGVLGR